MTSDEIAFNGRVVVMLAAAVVVLGVVGLAIRGIIKLFLAERRARWEAARNNYAAALQFLRANPTHPNARGACVDTGRVYYSLVMPDTATVHYQGGVITGVSNAQNNAASREAAINADIEAQIGHLRLPDASKPALDAECPQCGATCPTSARFCGGCGAALAVETSWRSLK